MEYKDERTPEVNASIQRCHEAHGKKNGIGHARASRPALMLLGLLVMFWGCGKSEENRPAASNQGSQTTQTVGGNATGPEASGAPVAPAARAIATADGEKAGTRVEITELKRSSDNTVTLRFGMVNDGSDGHSIGYDYGDGQQGATDYATIGGVTLVDGANKKKYFVVRDSENNCLCSRGLKDIPAKSRANLWAKFPAPPDDVQKISIVIPHFGPIDDVPISR